MNKLKIKVVDCMLGSVLSKDVLSHKGLKLEERDTIINDFIKCKLINKGIECIWIYDVSELELRSVEKINYHKIEECYKESIISLQRIFGKLESLKPLEFSKITDIAELMYKNIDDIDFIIEYLNATKGYKDYLLSHSINVSFYAMLIGKWMYMSKSKILDLIIAGLFHDVGKLEIPEYILNKNGSLTTEEFKMMKGHTTLGYDMIRDVMGVSEDIKKSVLMHHERSDGSGYPNGVNGDLTGEYAKIIAIADIYDAMTTDRVYKKKVNPFEAFQMFLGTGMRILEPNIVNIFILNLASHLLGVKTKLNNGEIYHSFNVSPDEIII